MRAGMSSRPSTMVMAGMVLSQPEMVTIPSNMWLRATSSTESATISRLISEPFIPSVPMVMPSVMETVFTSMGVPPAARMPCMTFSASFRWFQLQGMVPIHEWATPIWGRARSSSLKPTAFIMARAAARSGPSRRTRLCLRGSTAIGDSFVVGRARELGAILQQLAERDQRVALCAKPGHERGQVLHEAPARARYPVRVVQVVDGPRAGARDAPPGLLGGRHRAPALRLHAPEDARGAESTGHPEHGQVGLAPRRAEEARGRSRRVRDRGVAVHDLALGAGGPAAPEARVAPGVVAEVVTGLHDPPREVRRLPGPPADQEERAAHVLAREHVEHRRGERGIGSVVEGEADRAPRGRPAPDGGQREEVRAPGVGAPERGRRARREPARPLDAAGRLATSRVRRPLCTTSLRWFRIERSSITTPPSFRERLATVVETLRMVSPTRVGWWKRHSKPMNASTTRGGWGTLQPRPEDRQSGIRSGIAAGSAGRLSVSEPKSAVWVSVRVMAGVSRGACICTSSK